MPSELQLQALSGRHSSGTLTFALANGIRERRIDAVEAANSSHPGAPMGIFDAATVLFRKRLKFETSAPDWQDRCRGILSNA